MTGERLNALLDEHGGMLSRFCYTLCKNEHDADDLFQDTCVKLLKSDFEDRGAEETKSFLLRVCLNAFRTNWRRRRRIASAEVYGVEEEYLSALPDRTEDDRDYAALYRAIFRLPYKYRAVIALSYFRELPESTVADVLGIPRGTVKSRLYKAKQLLKKELMKNEDHR